MDEAAVSRVAFDAPWIPVRPASWVPVRLGSVLTQRVERNGREPKGEMLSVSGYTGVSVKSYEQAEKRRTAEELEDYRVARPGDLVVNTMWMNFRGLGVSDQLGYVSPAYRVYSIAKAVDPRFLHHLLRSNALVGKYKSMLYGIRPNSLQVKAQDFLAIEVPLPPRAHQAGIADFLDRETAHIDALIEKKECLIRLLDEKRAAMITHAVTKGLNPDVPMKDSGMAWIGKIPEHWTVAPLGRFTDAIEQGWSPLAEDRPADVDEWAVIKLSAVRSGEFVESEHKALPASLAGDHRFEIREGDLLITRANTPELVASACVVPYVRNRLMICDLVYRVNVDETVVRRAYLAHWLTSATARSHVEIEARGASLSMVKVSQGVIRRWPCVLPPMMEQRQIASYLEGAADRSRILAGKMRRSITLLRERRAALITAAVTGQLEIPGNPS